MWLRSAFAVLTTVAVAAGTAPPALPQAAAPALRAAPAACGADAIGTSRIVQIDTTGGPRYGHQQYRENDFLSDGEVVLTFDDGPSSIYTPQILRALDAHCAKATFFMLGSRALAEPRLVKEALQRGHTVGTHTWSHANLRAIGAVRAKDEIEMGISGVQRSAGQPIAPFFRFPYLADSRAMQAHLMSRSVAMFSIDADAYDYKTRNPSEVHRAIIEQITHKRKGIILFHDIQPATAFALNGLLKELKTRGFRVVHMVPKANATTEPAYDLLATRDASRRAIAAAAHPLAKRAVTWPMATIQPSPVPYAVGMVPLPQSSAPGASAAFAPWSPPPSAAPARRAVVDDDWRKKIFGN